MTTPSFIFVPSVYKQGLIYAELPADGSGDLTVSRGSVATRFNEDGLIELMVRNLCFNSQDWTSNWSANGVTVGANSTGFTAPNGGPTANAIVPTATNAVHRLSSNSTTAISYVSGQVYTASAHFAAGRGAAGRYVQLTLPSGAFSQGGFANFDLVDGTVTLVGGGTDANRSASIVNVGGGWFRCVFTATCNVTASTTGANVILITAPNATLAPTFLGSTGDLLFGWGAQVEDGRVVSEYQRADTGRFNIPRLDYLQPDGTVGCPALLVEPAASNGILNSTDTTTNWVLGPNLSRATIDVIGVSGTNLTVNGPGNLGSDGRISRSNNNFALASGSTYTISFFIKKTGTHTIGGYYANITGAAGGDLASGFDVSGSFSSGLIYGSAGITNRIRRVEQWGTDVFRCSETFTMTASGTLSGFFLAPIVSVTSPINPANGTQLGFAAPQVELGSAPTSFIPTTTAPITRNADVISKTGATALIGQTEGTAYIEVDFTQGFTKGAYILTLRSSNTVYAMLGIRANGRLAFQVTNTSPLVNLGDVPAGALSSAVFKIAFAYKSGDYALYMNGVQVGTAASTGVPTSLNEIRFSSEGTLGNDPLQGKVRAVALYTTRLSNIDLVNMTAPDGSFLWGLNAPIRLWGTATNEIWG